MKKILVSSYFICGIILSLLIMSSLVEAYKEDGKIGLLTVTESVNGTNQRGGVANLFLSIKPGSGRIYIDSFPLSRLDTQITMRFASELACDFLEVDCSGLDFFYTIRADSSIVGGPSAGAAATVLTVAMLDNQNINEKTVMTGTINSGFLIGPVAGISQKTLAAQQFGYTKALIPKWDILNESIEGLKIQIVPVASLEDALFEFTGKNYSKSYSAVYSSEEYQNIMKTVTIELCSKYGRFTNGTIILPNSLQETNQSKDYFKLALMSIENEEYYSAASYCFGGNVRLSRDLYENLSNSRLKQEYAKLLGRVSMQEEELNNKKITTVPELETYMIVKERINEAKSVLREQNPDNISGRDIAYSIERLDTAIVWSNFFKISGKNFDTNVETLSVACNKKIAETEERINYLQVYYPRDVDRSGIREAYDYLDSKEYALCIFTASKAKAEVDVVLGALFIGENDTSMLLEEKLNAASKVIARQEENGLFPILGYSYYEYANSLKNNETYSALLYAEYALEMSNLDMYLNIERQKLEKPFILDVQHISLFVIGFVLGALFVIFFVLAYVRFSKTKNVNNKHNSSKKIFSVKSFRNKK